MHIQYIISRWLQRPGEDWLLEPLFVHTSWEEVVDTLSTCEALRQEDIEGIIFGSIDINIVQLEAI